MVDDPTLEGGDIPKNDEPTPEPEKEEVNEPSESDTPPTSEAEKPEDKSKEESTELKTAVAQKKHWREKHDKLKESIEKGEKDKPEVPVSDKDWRLKTDFLLANSNKNYSQAEFDHISIVSKERKMSLNDAAKNEADYIQFNREKVENSKKVPGSSSAVGAGEKSDKEIGKMTDSEHEAYWKKHNEKQGTRI